MADVINCPTCKFPVTVRKGGTTVCPACNSFVMLLDLSKAKKKKASDDSDDASAEADKPKPPEEKVTCLDCDECFVLKESRAHGAKCPACGAQVLKRDPAALEREAEEEKEASRAKKTAKKNKSKEAAETPTKIKAGSKPRTRRDDYDDYDHDHPRGRRAAKRSGLSGAQIAGIVVLVALVVIGVPITLLVLAARPRAEPNEPQFAGPNLNFNPNLNPAPNPKTGLRPAPTAGMQWPEDTTIAEAGLPPAMPPFEVDPRMEQDARPVYLADMSEFAVRMGPWRLGKGELGDFSSAKLVIGGKAAPKGLGVSPWDRAATRVAYALGGKAVTFSGGVGLNDADIETFSPVVFKIIGDGRELWKSAPLTRAGGPASFRVDVRDVKVLELRAITLGPHNAAHAVWIDPVIEK